MRKRWSSRFNKKLEGLVERLEERKKIRLAKAIYQKERKKRLAAGLELRPYVIDKVDHKQPKNKKIA